MFVPTQSARKDTHRFDFRMRSRARHAFISCLHIKDQNVETQFHCVQVLYAFAPAKHKYKSVQQQGECAQIGGHALQMHAGQAAQSLHGLAVKLRRQLSIPGT